MGSLFGLFLALCAGFWLFMAARGMARELKRADRFKWIVGVMYVLILIGATGFFAAALSSARQATTVRVAVNGIAWSASSCLPLLQPDMAVPKARPMATLRKEERT